MMQEYTEQIANRFIADFVAAEGLLLSYALERMVNIIPGRAVGAMVIYESFDDTPVEAHFNYRELRFTHIQFFYGTMRRIKL